MVNWLKKNKLTTISLALLPIIAYGGSLLNVRIFNMETETLTIDEQLLTDFFTMKGNFEAHFVETTGWQPEDEKIRDQKNT